MSGAHAVLQSNMQAALLHNLSAPSGLLTPRGEAQFGVYLNAYRARLRSALRENFETLPLLIGDDGFEDLANAYINANPSQHYSLRWFGHALPAFMRANPDLSMHPAMVDFAELEWAMRQAFDAADCSALGVADLASLPGDDWPALRFDAHTSAQLLTLHWAVGPIWHALNSGEETVPEPQELSHTVLVWRQGLQPRWRSLDTAQADFVRGLITGLAFEELCNTLITHVGEAAAAALAATELRQLVEDGVIHKIKPK